MSEPFATAFLRETVAFAASGGWRLGAAGHLPPGPHAVPTDFFGICVATTPDPAGDDYVVARLRELGLGHVRLDLAPAGVGAYPERFLSRLLEDGFRVCLHLVQPFDEARAMPDERAAGRWRDFVAGVLDRYGSRLEMVEAGATCNRRKWAGYPSLTAFLTAWRIAREEARRCGVTLAGPNVTDFEPVYNVALLGWLRRRGLLPDIHTDNLFAERATEPEAFDHKIVGRALASLPKFNLLRKARLLGAVGHWAGVPRMVCPHVAWSLRRIRRVLADGEGKQADYLARYACLAAASGAMERLYWGPLVGQREGPIDDGTGDYPEIPHVTFYGRAAGDPCAWRIRPAFAAYRTAIRFLSGSQFVRAPASGGGLEIHEFRRGDETFHVVWTRNGRIAGVADRYPAEALRLARCFGRDGDERAAPPWAFGESPVYLLWPAGASPSVRSGAEVTAGIRVSSSKGTDYRLVEEAPWRGIVLGEEGDPRGWAPAAMEAAPESRVLRDRRNRVWAAPDPCDSAKRVVVKRHQVRGAHKRLIQRFRPPRALASWNGAHELLRRGLPTPRPRAAFWIEGRPTASSYYVCDEFPATGSVRQAFNTFRAGAAQYQDVKETDFYAELAKTLRELHDRGVFYRDLSAGNVLVRVEGGRVAFSFIDTARARFLPNPLPLDTRMADLKRILHPLHWPGREQFLSAYLTPLGVRPAAWMRRTIAGYDLKHLIKGALRPKRRLASALLGLVVGASAAWAGEVSPFPTRNQSPLAQMSGIPSAGPDFLVEDRTLAGVCLDVGNSFSAKSTDEEKLRLDGETYRFLLRVAGGLGHGFDAGVDIPYLIHSPGSFDTLIDDWHKWFGFNLPKRATQGRNRLLYSYTRDGRRVFQVTDDVSGFGDALVWAGARVAGGDDRTSRSLAVRAGIEIPTGEPDDLLGSGSTDVAVWFQGRDPASLAKLRVTAFASAGVVWAGENEALGGETDDFILFGCVGMGWTYFRRVTPKAQLDLHSPLDSGSRIRMLRNPCQQLTFGGAVLLAEGLTLDIGVGEDMRSTASPDVAFHFSLAKEL